MRNKTILSHNKDKNEKNEAIFQVCSRKHLSDFTPSEEQKSVCVFTWLVVRLAKQIL